MSGASGGSTHAPTRCLYVALNVPRDATSSDIKKAYRKQALQWHPDKNVGNEAEAHVRFQELQHSYAVLSDAHERKWYDEHRDEILNPARYGDDGANSDGEGGGGRTVNLTKYFSAAAFAGFGDDESGFYQTYSNAFREVWDSESEWGEVSSDARNTNVRWGQGDAPEMGGSTSTYEVAEEFYSSWSAFVSGLSFGWVDEYNVNEAENRRVRRLMEKENGRKRAVARRKYQDDVRALVDFCRRRDRRVIRHKLNLAKEKEARERRRKEDAARQKEDMKQRKQDWARARQAEEEAEEAARARDGGGKAFRLGETESEEEEEEEEDARGKNKKPKRRGGKAKAAGRVEEEMTTVFVCAVCKKDFKSKGQMSNHETSKAHKKKLKELDAQMLREALAIRKHDSTTSDEEDSDESTDDGAQRSDHRGKEGGQEEEEQEEEEEEEEEDFFMTSAMREINSEDDGKGPQAASARHSRDAPAKHIPTTDADADADDARAGSDSDSDEGRGGRRREAGSRGRGLPETKGRPREAFKTHQGHGGRADAEPRVARRAKKKRGKKPNPRPVRDTMKPTHTRGAFDFGTSSSSSSSNSSSSNSSSSSSSSDEDSSSDSDSGSGSGSGSVSGGDSGSEEDPSLLETLAAASAAAGEIDPDGSMRTAAAVAASAAAVAAANTAAGRFHLTGDLGAAVSAATSAGLSWWKKHNAEDSEEEGGWDKVRGKETSSEGEANKHHGNAKGSGRHGSMKDRHSREADGVAEVGGGAEGHGHGHGQGHGRGRGHGSSKRVGARGESSSDGGSSGRDKVPEPTGKRGSHKAGSKGGKGKGNVESELAADKGARRRRRQALKAAKGGHVTAPAAAGGSGGEDGLRCRVCGRHFHSRSKLFAHVKAEGHALLAR